MTLTELLDGQPAPPALVQSESEKFYAFCPNPLCERNEAGTKIDDSPYVKWTSGREYFSEEFAETNYCESCGTQLIKECPSCGKRLSRAGTRFCITCGAPVVERPTHEEWEEIRKLAPAVDEEPPF
jgi:hypothetical protein